MPLRNNYLCAVMLLARRLRALIAAPSTSSSEPFLQSATVSICAISTSSSIDVSGDNRSSRGGGGGGDGQTLGRRLLSLIYPKRSAVIALQKWAEEGKAIQKYQLNRVVRELRKHKRFKHALEVPVSPFLFSSVFLNLRRFVT